MSWLVPPLVASAASLGSWGQAASRSMASALRQARTNSEAIRCQGARCAGARGGHRPCPRPRAAPRGVVTGARGPCGRPHGSLCSWRCCRCWSPHPTTCTMATSPLYLGSFPLVSSEHLFNDGHFLRSDTQKQPALNHLIPERGTCIWPKLVRSLWQEPPHVPSTGDVRAAPSCPTYRWGDGPGDGTGHSSPRWWTVGWLALGTGGTAAPPWRPPLPRPGQCLQEAPVRGLP